MSIGRQSRTRILGSPYAATVANWMRVGFIRSIQRGSTTITNGNTSATSTITSVNLTDSVVRFLGCSTNDGTSSMGRVALTNATTITVTRSGNTNNTTVSWEVIEYLPGLLKSVQRGTIALAAAAGSNTATITAVTLDKAALDYLGASVVDGGAPTNAENNNLLVLTNATTVTASRSGTTFDAVVGYQVAEFVN